MLQRMSRLLALCVPRSQGHVRLGFWLCENSERAFTEGNRVLPAPRFPCCLATVHNDIGAGEEGHSMRSACPTVLTRPSLIADSSASTRMDPQPTSRASANCDAAIALVLMCDI